MKNTIKPGSPRRQRRRGISVYLAGAFGLTMVFLALVVGTTTVNSFDSQRTATLDALQSSANFEAQALDNGLNRVLSYIQTTVSGSEIASLDPQRCSPVLAGFGQTLNEGMSIAIMRADGQIICASDARLANSSSWEQLDEWVGRARSTGRTVIQPGVPDVLTGKIATVLAAPMLGHDGSHAIIVATLPFSTMLDGPNPSFPSKQVYVVLSSDRSRIYSRHSGRDRTFDGTTELSGIGRALPSGTATVKDVDGGRRIYRAATVPSTGWHVLIGVAPADAFASACRDFRRSLVLGALMMAAVVGLGVLLHRRLVRPVCNLRRAIEAAARETGLRAKLEGPAEVAAVAEAFNATLAEREAFERQLTHQALHDPLTDLPNRTLLTDRLRQALARQERHGGLVAVTFLDLDRFKLINDAHGHPAGDQLLVALAQRLCSAVRPDDTVARFGGDEFVVLSEGLDTEQEAIAIASRLTDALRLPFTLKVGSVFLAGSVGVAVARGGENPDDLIRNADAAMYEAKGPHHESVAVYDERMHFGVVSRLDTERDLHRALAENQLILQYQPKLSLSTGGMVGSEALVRWAHPTRGILSPAEFISIAEETGLIMSLGEWVLVEACHQTVRWRRDHGLAMTVAVNLSARQLASADLPETVADVLRSTGANAQDLWIEITEGSLLYDASAAADRLAAIRALGVRVSIDDFGTGYSSLSYLRTLPIDELKIDRSFITDVADDARASAIVKSVVELGHALGLVVIAEGVETEAQLDSVRRLGCDLAQGYYLGRPQHADDIAASQRDRRSRCDLSSARSTS